MTNMLSCMCFPRVWAVLIVMGLAASCLYICAGTGWCYCVCIGVCDGYGCVTANMLSCMCFPCAWAVLIVMGLAASCLYISVVHGMVTWCLYRCLWHLWLCNCDMVSKMCFPAGGLCELWRSGLYCVCTGVLYSRGIIVFVLVSVTAVVVLWWYGAV